jgi:hypothetical protein
MIRKSSTEATPLALKRQVRDAISDWVASLSFEEARTKSVFFSGVGYSPLQIQTEVEHETPFGVNFLSGLCALNEVMVSENPKASVVELIRDSIRQVTS